MAKLIREDKIKIYKEREDGKALSSLSREYDIASSNIEYLVRLIDRHGESILRTNTNNYYSKELKQEIINKVLVDGQSIKSTSIEYGLTSGGLLNNWIRSYKENNCVIVEKTKGRKLNTMTKIRVKETLIDYDSMSDEKTSLKNRNATQFSLRE